MKLLSSVLFVVAVSSCIGIPVVPPKVEAPPTGPARSMMVEFAPDKPPVPEDLYICSPDAAGKLWCVEYEAFLKQLAKSKGPREEL